MWYVFEEKNGINIYRLFGKEVRAVCLDGDGLCAYINVHITRCFYIFTIMNEFLNEISDIYKFIFEIIINLN